jgi:hypothetical protein
MMEIEARSVQKCNGILRTSFVRPAICLAFSEVAADGDRGEELSAMDTGPPHWAQLAAAGNPSTHSHAHTRTHTHAQTHTHTHARTHTHTHKHTTHARTHADRGAELSDSIASRDAPGNPHTHTLCRICVRCGAAPPCTPVFQTPWPAAPHGSWGMDFRLHG